MRHFPVRLLLLVMILLFAVNAAGMAEGEFFLPLTAGDGRNGIAEASADLLGLTVVTDEDEDVLLNRTATETGHLLLDTQSAVIRCLQGYTDGEFFEIFSPVARVGTEAICLVMRKERADELGITGLDSLLTYIAENEYEFLRARYPDAGIKDMAATEISNELAVFTDYYYEEEIAGAMEDDEVQLALKTETELAAGAEDLIILCTIGRERSSVYPDLPTLSEAGIAVEREIRYYLITANGTDPGYIRQVAETLAVAGPVVTGAELTAELEQAAAECEAYLTSEGLFFYK